MDRNVALHDFHNMEQTTWAVKSTDFSNWKGLELQGKMDTGDLTLHVYVSPHSFCCYNSQPHVIIGLISFTFVPQVFRTYYI